VFFIVESIRKNYSEIEIFASGYWQLAFS